MNLNNKKYVLDIGNSRAKLALVESNEVVWVKSILQPQDLIKAIDSIWPIIVSNVSDQKWMSELEKQNLVFHELRRDLAFPFKSIYNPILSLGMDRICNVCALSQLEMGSNRLVIDMGSCIKFDFLDHQNIHRGGSISPGLSMRFKSMHQQTALLPLLEIDAKTPIENLGTNTQDCMTQGVLGSVQAELIWRLEQFNKSYEKLNVFLTGGDSAYFDLGQKNHIFADENLTLKGINQLYEFQIAL